jgi:hypothetical protein
MTNYHNSPEVFNNYFLTISENIIKSIRLNKQKHDTYNSPNYYLLNQPHSLRAAARKLDTQPSTPHCTDNLKTKHQI